MSEEMIDLKIAILREALEARLDALEKEFSILRESWKEIPGFLQIYNSQTRELYDEKIKSISFQLESYRAETNLVLQKIIKELEKK
jgi:hypothetical protein